jgi:hypothetical protein
MCGDWGILAPYAGLGTELFNIPLVNAKTWNRYRRSGSTSSHERRSSRCSVRTEHVEVQTGCQ